MKNQSLNFIKEELIKLLDMRYNENYKIDYKKESVHNLKALGREQDTIKSIRDIIML